MTEQTGRYQMRTKFSLLGEQQSQAAEFRLRRHWNGLGLVGGVGAGDLGGV